MISNSYKAFSGETVQCLTANATIAKVGTSVFNTKTENATPFIGVRYDISFEGKTFEGSGTVFKAYQDKAQLKVGDSVEVRIDKAELKANSTWNLVSAKVAPLSNDMVARILAL